MLKYILTIFSLGLLVPTLTLADDIGMVTGSSYSTYFKFGEQIAEVSKQMGVNILVKVSNGSIANIERLASTENVALAIVQTDILSYLRKDSNPRLRRFAHKLRIVSPLYEEEIHLFSRKNIKNISDLNGKRVIVGFEGSNTNLTAENIMEIMNVTPKEKVYKLPRKGVSLVIQDEADAVFFVSQKPLKLFESLFSSTDEDIKNKLTKVHFVPLDDKKIVQSYNISYFTKQDYNIIKEKIPTVAVKVALVSFDFSSNLNDYYKKRCKQINSISHAIDNKWSFEKNKVKHGWKSSKCSYIFNNTEPRSRASSDNARNELTCGLYGLCIEDSTKKEHLAKEKAEKEKLAIEKTEQVQFARERTEREQLASERAEQEQLDSEIIEEERRARQKEKIEEIPLVTKNIDSDKTGNRVDQEINKLKTANIAFNSPSTMMKNKSYIINLKLSATKSTEELLKEIKSNEKDSSVISYSTKMQAQIISENKKAFEITTITPSKQPISAINTTTWTWSIVPLDSGTHYFHIILIAFIKLDDNEMQYPIKTFDQEIEVYISTEDELLTFLEENWKWLLGSLIFPLIIWLRKIRNSDKNEQENTSKT